MGRFKLTLRKDLRLDYPRAETPTHYMTMAMDPTSINAGARTARHDRAAGRKTQFVARGCLYALQSGRGFARDATVNGSKGIHCMIAKSVVHGRVAFRALWTLVFADMRSRSRGTMRPSCAFICPSRAQEYRMPVAPAASHAK